MATPMQVSVKRTVIRNIPTQLGIDPIGMLIYRNGPFASNKQFADTAKEFLKGFMRQGLASSLPHAGFVCADRCVYSGKQQVDTETEQDIAIKRYSYTIEVGIDDVPSSINAVQSSE